eukprot:m.61429 g.61429  ORF g.61429 m.61429 type:complete len:56 (-) comp9558_c0_seq2:78-245(-)
MRVLTTSIGFVKTQALEVAAAAHIVSPSIPLWVSSLILLFHRYLPAPSILLHQNL